MTWQDLKTYIDQQSNYSDSFLEQKVKVYDHRDGEEYEINVLEMLEERPKHVDSGWVSYITINNEVEHGEVKETSFA
jgi:hypothetical protein